MKKFILIFFVYLILATNSANADILKDGEGFSYIKNYDYLIFFNGK